METYSSLHNHTSSSNERLIDSINKPQELIKYAFELGLSSLAITDHETVNAHVKCLNYLHKMREKDDAWKKFKIILGNEIYLCRNGMTKENFNPEIDSFYHFILLAKDIEGHHQIRQLSNIAYEHSFVRNDMVRPFVYYNDLEEIISKNPGHIIASTACIGGFIGKKLLKAREKEKTDKDFFNSQIEMLENWIDYVRGIFGKENFYLELQPSEFDDQRYVNDWLIKFSKKLDVPTIITTDSHYYSKEYKNIHKIFLNSKDGDREVDEFYSSAYLMSAEEIHEYLDKYIGADFVSECLANTLKIESQIEEYELKRPFKLPYLPSEEDIKLAKNVEFDFPSTVNFNWDIWNYFIKSKEDSDKVLIHRILKKCNSDKNRFWAKRSLDEIEIELKTVRDSSIKQNMVWSKYFLQVADYIDIMWTDGDSIVGPGRGSGVGFYLNYLLDITQVDPLREKVPVFYWRFLNPERASILDIDSDCQSNKRNKIIKALQNRYGEKRVVRVLTKKTEASKSAILTAARGLGIDIDTAQFIASLVEADRGAQRSLHDTYYGNEEKSFLPNKMFKEEIDKYPNLFETACTIEGIETNCSSHAGGVIIVDEDFTNTAAMMKIKSGDWVSCWDLHESEDSAGLVKIDLLATEALTYIRTCLDLLVDAGLTPRMPTLRETYEKCIGVYNLNRDDKKMWERLGNGELLNIFQMDTPQGKQGIGLVKPSNVEELTALNSVMRLSTEDAEQPMAKYTRFKNDKGAWDKEMIEHGLSDDERKLLHSYLDIDHGLAVSQEEMMMLLLDGKIAGWPLGQVDKCRKAVAKKNPKLYEEISQQFFENAENKGLSKNLTAYVWNILIAPQKTYSFCSAHGLAYSIVGLQEMNLACMYPTIFWNTANLIVDSAGIDEEEKEAEEKEDEKKKGNRMINYGKTASAIGKFKKIGIAVLPPDINTSSYTFLPNAETNTITYGLRGITRISGDLIKDIMNNRPYSSITDFLAKVNITKIQMINLIKSGAFDNIESNDRYEVLKNYIASTCDLKKRITMQNMQALIDYNLIPVELDELRKLYLFNKFLKTNKSGNYYKLNFEAVNFIEKMFGVDDIINGDMIEIKTWEKMYKKAIDPIQTYIKLESKMLLEKINNAIISEEMGKYASGNISRWEMESISFYSHPHELYYSNAVFANFDELPFNPSVKKVKKYRGKEYKVFETTEIGGTVIDKDKGHNTVTLLTEDGVAVIKIYKDLFSNYDKQVSRVNPDGSKTVIEKSWFTRGTLLIAQGFRRGDNFVLRKGSDSSLPLITKIEKINPDGSLELKYEREADES